MSAYSAADIEDYLAGVLAADRTAALERAAEEDEELAMYLMERRAERDAFLLDPRRRSFQSLVEEAGPERRPWALWTMGLVAAAAAVFLLIPRGEAPGVRTKGGLSVKAAIQGEGAPRMFDASDGVHPGDRIRLTVEDPGGGFLTVLLEERSGDVDILYRPEELGELVPGAHMLPDSLRLDDALGRERLYVIMSNERLDPEVWKKEIRRSNKRAGFDHGWLPPRGTRVRIIEYEKVEPK